MKLHNTSASYGMISMGFHWVSALLVIGLFGLGLWMVDLSYYDEWYRTAPLIHKGTGFILLLLTLLRLLWKLYSPAPLALQQHKPIERRLAKATHHLIYVLLFLLMFSGYLISTADGRALEVFDWFSIPATIHGIERQEDIAGDVHEILAYSLIALVVLHAAGAIKHHVIDKDNTLRRMLGL
ncbi:MAG: cytochrome b [Gammaproteobacteria bacterium]|nr:MAG: cytochrome b [Gammaproteobacteria bacterium]